METALFRLYQELSEGVAKIESIWITVQKALKGTLPAHGFRVPFSLTAPRRRPPSPASFLRRCAVVRRRRARLFFLPTFLDLVGCPVAVHVSAPRSAPSSVYPPPRLAAAPSGARVETLMSPVSAFSLVGGKRKPPYPVFPFPQTPFPFPSPRQM